MKVLHLISGGDSGGARTHVHLLLKHLNEDNEATLVCFMRGTFSEGAEALGIPTMVIEKPMFAALRQLRRMIAEGGYELIHCHGSRGNVMGALLKPFCRLPVITTVHSDPRLDYLGRPLARVTYGTLNAMALRRMDYWIGVSDAMREILSARGFDSNRIYAIYNGVEFEGVRDAEPGERERFFEEVGLNADENSVVVGIGARLDPVKDIPTLLRGFKVAYTQHPNLRLLIAGEGPERANLEALAGELGISGAVCFAGWQTDMERFYRCIDINTLTSLSETFSYAVTEGARARLPVVSTRVGGLPKLVIPDQTGYLFEPGDAAALGGYLSRLAADPALRARLGNALYDKTRAEYSAAATAERQLQIYRHVLEAAKAGRSGVLICGAYGMKNAGDEAVLDAILAEMRSIDPDMPLTVMSRAPAETREEHKVKAIHSFDFLRFLRIMRRSALYVNGGGSLIQDVTSNRSLWYYLYTLSAAKRRGCKVMMYGCGIGPVNHAGNRLQAGRIIDKYVDAITLRESRSLAVLQSLGVTRPEISVSGEPALSLERAPDWETDALLERCGLEPGKKYFCLCIRRWPGLKRRLSAFAAAADYAYVKYGMSAVLLSVNPRQDDDTILRLREKVKVPCAAVTEFMDTPQLIGFLSRMHVVLAMRLHALVLAAGQAVPTVGVSYDPKVASFLEELGRPNYIEFNELTEAAQLYPLIDAAAAADREALCAATDAIKTAERRNTDTARRLLGK